MSVFFGRDVELETRETMKVGNVILNNKPMRIKVYEIQDDLNMLSNWLWEKFKDTESTDRIKKIKSLVNSL
jgi:hypothetical protein